MPVVNGSLKTNELKLQGTEGVDYRLKVENDELNIKRGTASLMTIGMDAEQVLSGSDVGSDKININAPVTFTSSLSVKSENGQ